MGACNFRTTIGGKKLSAADAYRDACEQATFDHGHDPYNGTISTTQGFVMIDPGKRRIDNVVDDVISGKIRSAVEKWGPAGCIELKGKALRDWKARNGLAGTQAKAYTFFGWAAE